MTLEEILHLNNATYGAGAELTEDRLKQQLPNLRNMIAFFREYPDLFIDFLIENYKGDDCTFHFYFYQRIFLRVVMRHRYVYATFPRA